MYKLHFDWTGVRQAVSAVLGQAKGPMTAPELFHQINKRGITLPGGAYDTIYQRFIGMLRSMVNHGWPIMSAGWGLYQFNPEKRDWYEQHLTA